MDEVHARQMTMTKPYPYRAFMVKLIPVTSETSVLWRVVLENPYTGERKGFKDLDAMVRFLQLLLYEGGECQCEQEESR